MSLVVNYTNWISNKYLLKKIAIRLIFTYNEG